MIFCYFYVVNKSINGGTYSGAAGRESSKLVRAAFCPQHISLHSYGKKTLIVLLVTLVCIDTNWPLYFSLL